MKQEWQDIISEHLGVQPIEIDSNLITGANRRRLYWTNIPNVTVPEKNDSTLSSVLESGQVDKEKAYCIDANYGKGSNLNTYFNKSRRQIVFNGNKKVGEHKGQTYVYRLLTPIECERLHGVPENYTNHVSRTNRYHMLGNGWSVQVIKHIFKNIIMYEVTFKNIFTKETRTISLGESRTIANEQFKKVKKTFKWWWISSVINC